MQFHPVADLFPLMSENEFSGLCADIKANGLRERIWMHRGQIVDGRNRYNACIATGVEPRYQDWDGVGSLVSFVISLNLNRRHLNESQRAMVAAKLANLDKAGRPSEIGSSEPIISQTTAAEMLNVSRSSTRRAAGVLKHGVPELVEQVVAGEYSVVEARRLSNLSPERQRRIVKIGRKNSKKMREKMLTRSLKKTEDGFVSCFHCSPHVVWDDDHLSAFAQALILKANQAHKDGRSVTNYAPFFDSIAFDISESQVSAMVVSHREKILAAIDAGTLDGENGMRERNDLLRVTKIPANEFELALVAMLDYDEIEICYQQGKTEGARGARKTIYKRGVPKEQPRPKATIDDDDDDPPDVYYDRHNW